MTLLLDAIKSYYQCTDYARKEIKYWGPMYSSTASFDYIVDRLILDFLGDYD